MLNARYQYHFKRLGKLAYLWQIANSGSTAIRNLLAVFAEEIADGTSDSVNGILVFEPYILLWGQNTGNATLATLAQNAASAYLVDASFTGDLTTTPTNKNSTAAVLAALQTEMSAAVDNKTLSTLASTGFVAFFNSLLSSPGTWNTAADASADYKDSVYVVGTLV